MKPAVPSADAVHDITQQALWYDQQSPGLGEAFITEVDRTMLRIEQQPSIGIRISDMGHRKVKLDRPFHKRFSVVYLEIATEILVVAVWAGERNPNDLIQRF